MSAKKPLALVILDGYGYREDTASNAIANAKNTSNGCTNCEQTLTL